MGKSRLTAALQTQKTGRCAEGCETTRAMFAAAIEREVAGEGPDQALYARLDACPRCAKEYITALDLAYRLDEDMPRAADVPPLKLPLSLRVRERNADTEGGLRRVAEDQAPYLSPPSEDAE
jgi:hypothetical protein